METSQAPSRRKAKVKNHVQSPCILESLDTRETVSGDVMVNFNEALLEDAVKDDLHSLTLYGNDFQESKSVLLLNAEESLCVLTVEQFTKKLAISPSQKVKVVSIFGNTGEGKSHSLNETFFKGEKVFLTSASQKSCTMGVWAAFDPIRNIICLDTEGFLGVSTKENQRTRLLLKVLAVSDVIIYRTRAERLQRDMYTFLGSASKAYKEHFSGALKQILEKFDCDKSPTALGPSVIIFHETKYTQTLHQCATVNESAEDIIRSNFEHLQMSFDAFSSVKYIGLQSRNDPTSYKELQIAVQKELERTDVRSARHSKFIYLTLKALNDKYQTELSTATPQLYLPAFFTCQEKCLSCKSNCNLSMGHRDESLPHSCDIPCTFQHQYQNCVLLCKTCYKNGIKSSVTPKYHTDESWTGIFSYMWSGYSIDCPKCGLLYKSRKHWYGNRNPEECAVRQEIVHIWPGEKSFQDRTIFGTQHSAQRVVDGVTVISDIITDVTSQSVKVVSDWMTDRVRPSYWVPDHEINECHLCHKVFTVNDRKHHCRACGEGFCDTCSSRKQPVPVRGFPADVRVCDSCYRESPPSLSESVDPAEVRARQISETVVTVVSAVKSTVVDIPKKIIKDSARPSYWTPDSECIRCAVCGGEFGIMLALHHCRNCGKGVCDECSKARKPVYARGWETPVRVCDKCG